MRKIELRLCLYSVPLLRLLQFCCYDKHYLCDNIKRKHGFPTELNVYRQHQHPTELFKPGLFRPELKMYWWGELRDA